MNNPKKLKITTAVLLCTIVLLTTIPFGKACTIPSEPEVKLDVTVDAGSTHFRGEIVEFYILVSLSGKPIDAQTIDADLYFDGTYFADLTSTIQRVSVGLYRAIYTIPNDASIGTYALEVNACYYTAKGTALKCFLLSETLTNWNAWLIDITSTTASIKTDIGIIQVSLDNLNAKITSIDEKSVNIHTDIGVIKTDLNTINTQLSSINGSVATITTNIGQIQVDLTEINSQITIFNETTVTIQTDLGSLKTSIDTILEKVIVIEGNTVEIITSLGKINGTITQIQDDIAIIKTDIGEIKVTLLSMKTAPQETSTSNPTSVWWILALIVAIAAITFLAVAIKNRRNKA